MFDQDDTDQSGSPRASFEEEGLVHIERFIRDADFKRLLVELERFHHDVVPKMPREQVYYETPGDPATLKQLQHLDEHDAYFRELLWGGAPRRLAEILLDGPVVPKNFQWFNKPPGVGRATPPHQDGYYFMLDPCEATTLWLALEEVDEENGCVRYIPGSHRDGMRSHGRTGTLGFSQGISDYGTPEDLARERAYPAGPGDLLAHHAMTIHRADGNTSANRTRRALGFIYYSERAREDAEAHAEYQRKLHGDLAREKKI